MPSTPISILPDLRHDAIHLPPTAETGEDDDVPGPRPYLPPLTSVCPVLVEDGDLWSARKNFSAQHNRWRRRMATHLQQNTELFPLLQQRTGGDPARIRGLIDEEASTQQALTRMLQVMYPERDLGNHADPLDELIYIMISRRTREGAYQDVFRRLKARFAGWGEMAQAEVEEIHAITGTAGMGLQRAADLQQALHLIHAQFGCYSLDDLREWTDDRAEAFLTTLPGVGPKTAYCVLMYSLGRAAFPVDAHTLRVLARVGVFREAGLDLTHLDHKRAQAILADLIAPELRHSLHVSLVLHGRTVCQPRPRCGECAVRNMCGFYRAAQVLESEQSGRPTMVDLFCGAGGLSEGFRQAGFRTVLAVDSNPVALRTYRLNHPEVPEYRVICEDLVDFRKDAERLRTLLGDQKIDVLIGGPPCQGFSRAGWRSRGTGRRFTASEDDRNYLFQELVGLLHVMKPRIFVMENVPGVGEVKFEDGTNFLDVMQNAMRRAGYTTEVWILNAAAYGAPQNRVRKIIVGVHGASRLPAGLQRQVTGLLRTVPPVQHRATSNQYREDSRSADETLPPPVTLAEAIGDLPPVKAGEGLWVQRTGARPEGPSRFDLPDAPIRHPQGLLTSHVSRYQNETDLERYAELQPGENYLDLLKRRSDLRNYSTNSFFDKYYRLEPYAPSKAMVAHLRKDGNSYIHPEQVRSLTVREAARIQSFADSYIFTGSRGDQFQQIGNAVPPRLARAIGMHLQRMLELLQQTTGQADRP
ncbi:DNA (cytosine-5-)-methyltransferase [Deinococcus sp. D7000]|nr:DNA (cytosine-5-)-methyltransferase [Deinococcus sp. D7000]